MDVVLEATDAQVHLRYQGVAHAWTPHRAEEVRMKGLLTYRKSRGLRSCHSAGLGEAFSEEAEATRRGRRNGQDLRLDREWFRGCPSFIILSCEAVVASPGGRRLVPTL